MNFSRPLPRPLLMLLACLLWACDGSRLGSESAGSNLTSRTDDAGITYLCIDDDDDDVDEDADEGVDEASDDDDDVDEDADETVDEASDTDDDVDEDADEGIDEDCFPMTDDDAGTP